MKITSYGLFWRLSEIQWEPGRGIKDSFRLLGHIGEKRPTVRVGDFRAQTGIYILYDEYGASYVGLSRRGLGPRLKEHLNDKLADKWDRFSWFGFKELSQPGTDGVYRLDPAAEDVSESTHTTIGDLEALLIRAIGPKHNTAWMNFKSASEWLQVPYEEVDTYLERVAPSE